MNHLYEKDLIQETITSNNETQKVLALHRQKLQELRTVLVQQNKWISASEDLLQAYKDVYYAKRKCEGHV